VARLLLQLVSLLLPALPLVVLLLLDGLLLLLLRRGMPVAASLEPSVLPLLLPPAFALVLLLLNPPGKLALNWNALQPPWTAGCCCCCCCSAAEPNPGKVAAAPDVDTTPATDAALPDALPASLAAAWAIVGPLPAIDILGVAALLVVACVLRALPSAAPALKAGGPPNTSSAANFPLAAAMRSVS
jgi:hypothetical protein